MKNWTEWKATKVISEFNGPMGQSDPTGISQPTLQMPAASPVQPMTTQPGMTMFAPKQNFKMVYQQFLNMLKQTPVNQQSSVLGQLQRDVKANPMQMGNPPALTGRIA